MQEYPYTVSTDFPEQVVSPDEILKQVRESTISSANFKYVDLNGDACGIWFDGELSGADQTELAGIVAAHKPMLNGAKRKKIREIRDKSKRLIADGFTYNGKVFNLSIESQVKFEAWANASLTSATVNTLDELESYDLADAAAVTAFATACRDALKAILDGGTTLKDQVRVATTVAEVEAVTDSR